MKLILSTLQQPEEYTPRLSAFRWTLLGGSDQYVDTGFNVSLVGGTGGTPAPSGVDLLDFQKDAYPTPKSQHSPSKGYRREQVIGIKAPGNRPKVVSVAGSGSGSATRANPDVPWKPILNRIFLLLNQLCGAYDAFDMVSKLT